MFEYHQWKNFDCVLWSRTPDYKNSVNFDLIFLFQIKLDQGVVVWTWQPVTRPTTISPLTGTRHCEHTFVHHFFYDGDANPFSVFFLQIHFFNNRLILQQLPLIESFLGPLFFYYIHVY